MAVDDDAAGGEEAAVVDEVHADLNAAAGDGGDGYVVISRGAADIKSSQVGVIRIGLQGDRRDGNWRSGSREARVATRIGGNHAHGERAGRSESVPGGDDGRAAGALQGLIRAAVAPMNAIDERRPGGLA